MLRNYEQNFRQLMLWARNIELGERGIKLCYGLATLYWGRGESSYVMGSQHCIGGEGDQAMIWVRNIVLGGEGGSSYVMGSQHCIGGRGGSSYVMGSQHCIGGEADQAMLWVGNIVLGGEGEFLKTFLKFP